MVAISPGSVWLLCGRQGDEGLMRILLFHSDRTGELLCCLRRALEATPARPFEVMAVSLEESGRLLWNQPRLNEARPELIMLCLAAEAMEESTPAVAALLEQVRGTPVMLVAEEGPQQPLDELMRLGVTDFILAPLRPQELRHRLWRLAGEAGEKGAAVYHLKERLGLRQFIGESERFVQEIAKLPRLAQCDVTVLIGGETGTGKEMVARAIHHLSSRSDRPFIPVNCGALPDDLVENELFGHQRGAFTGASVSSFGLIHEADGGSIFLDEIDALSAKSQVKLLRFLQEKEYRPLGSSKTCRADVRVLAASNADMEQIVRAGRFRSDLFYRLNVVPLRLPPLRERQQDIPLLAQHCLEKYSLALKLSSRGFSPAALQKLKCYDWPGNIRELENLVERALILSGQSIITSQDIGLPAGPVKSEGGSFKAQKAKVIADFERGYLQQLLLEHGGNVSQAARAAKKHRRALWQLMRKHHLASPRMAVTGST